MYLQVGKLAVSRFTIHLPEAENGKMAGSRKWKHVALKWTIDKNNNNTAFLTFDVVDTIPSHPAMSRKRAVSASPGRAHANPLKFVNQVVNNVMLQINDLQKELSKAVYIKTLMPRYTVP